MRAAGAIDRRGNFRADVPGVRAREGQPEFLLVPAAETGHGRDITITRGDVNEIQLAKAAIRAGIDVLLREAQCEPDEARRDRRRRRLRLVPRSLERRAGRPAARVPLQRFRQVGNAAGAGARQMLLSVERRRAAQAIARRVEYVELAAHPAFHRGFVNAMSFED